jgi:hypothetical protein
MARRADDGEMFWGYSVDRSGRVIVAQLQAPRYIGTEPVIELELDNGKKVQCTPDHRFVTRDGWMVEAQDLRPGQSMMPLYRQYARGYETVYQPIERSFSLTHLLADEWNMMAGMYEEKPVTHRYYQDLNKRNNCPWNIARKGGDGQNLTKGRDLYNNIRFSQGESTSIQQNQNVFQCFPEMNRSLPGQESAWNNHKIVAIRDVPGQHDVYCLTVPEAGNFALDAGVFVSNCGLIVNVTPFEPEWEGYVTLEISNTTPLPARIYANEGIAQVLFFEGDEPCERSYADKKGKYQYQQSIELPKI